MFIYLSFSIIKHSTREIEIRNKIYTVLQEEVNDSDSHGMLIRTEGAQWEHIFK